MAWVLAAAALAAAVAIPIYQDSRDRELRAQAERDAQLLDDVNAQLSRSGPLAMDSLMQLMAAPVGGPPNETSRAPGNEPAIMQDKGGIQ
jgi:dihydrodipicolinate synthase/N-acetylneuraminate lyase